MSRQPIATAGSMQQAIGRTAEYMPHPNRSNFNVAVRITDARTNYGRIEYYIQPQAGTGGMWIVAGNLRIEPQP